MPTGPCTGTVSTSKRGPGFRSYSVLWGGSGKGEPPSPDIRRLGWHGAQRALTPRVLAPATWPLKEAEAAEL